MPDARIEPVSKSEDVRIRAVHAAVRSWRPGDEQGQESKRRFEEHLKKFMKQMSGESGDELDEIEVTTSAVVVGDQRNAPCAYDLLPKWITPIENAGQTEEIWEVVQRKVRRQAGVFAHHPDGGPEIFEVEIVDDDDAHRIHIDVRFLFFADVDPTELVSPSAKWFDDDEAKLLTNDTFEHALEFARSLRDEALR